MADDDYLLVVAMDFGTTFSGYAFSYKTKPYDIKLNKNWGANMGHQSYKTATSVLVNPKGEFEAFGFEAQQKYADLEEKNVTPEKYALYEKFKMMLHGKKIDGSKLLIHSTNGCIRPAIDIFAMAIGYLRDHLMKTLSSQLASMPPDNKDIRWVLTVPAIWGDAAKQFMRRAAEKAKLVDEVNSSQLLIALEPEAASLYCRTLEMEHFCGMKGEEGMLNLEVNTKYMIIDAGGGTIDIAVHETQLDGKVKELYKANGGAWGGCYVDKLYEKMLGDIFGHDFITYYKQSQAENWLEMMIDFEKRKKAVQPDGTTTINISMGYTFVTKFEEITGRKFTCAVEESSVSGIKFSSGTLRISASKMASLFDEVIQKIQQHIKDLLEQQALRSIKYIFLVGGFGECTILQNMIQQQFGRSRTTLIPDDASLCVLKGAVIHGHRLVEISSRVSKYTYAVGKSREFIPGKDNEKFRKVSKGTGLSRRSFLRSLVNVGESLAPGTIRSTTVHPHTPDKRELKFVLYYSEDILSNESHPTDANVYKLSKVTIDSPDTAQGKDRQFRVSIVFGGTEIYFIVKEEGKENVVATTIDFDI